MKDKQNFYNFYIDKKNKTVIAVCRYAGRNVRATAKCHDSDVFDIEFGKRLAQARCEVKVAKIKIQNATQKYCDAVDVLNAAMARYEAMRQYYMDAVDQYDNALVEIDNILKENN